MVAEVKQQSLGIRLQQPFVARHVARGFLRGGVSLLHRFVPQLDQVRTQLDGRDDDPRYLHHQVLVALAFDAHDHALLTVIHAAPHLDAVTRLQFNLVGSEISDFLVVVLRGGDEVHHRAVGYHQIFLMVRVGRLPHVQALFRPVDKVLHLFLGASHKHQTGDGGHQGALRLFAYVLIRVFQGNKRLQAVVAGFIPHLQLLMTAGTP